MDYDRADALRQELRSNGVEMLDKEHCWKTSDGREGSYDGAAAPEERWPTSHRASSDGRADTWYPLTTNGSRKHGHSSTSEDTLSDSAINQLVGDRERARAVQDFATADVVRDTLRSHGVEVYDSDRTWKASDGRRGVIVTGGEQECHLSTRQIQSMIAEREAARKATDYDR